MHVAALRFCKQVKRSYPEFFRDSSVLEVGSRNVNGSVRCLFSGCQYTGIDCVHGPDVDIVAFGHSFESPDGPECFDVVCSCETFEHDPYAEHTVQNMLKHLRPGGLFFMTCAGVGRPEHGTARVSGGVFGPDPGFYRNVTEEMFLGWCGVSAGQFAEWGVKYNPLDHDLYFFGVKA